MKNIKQLKISAYFFTLTLLLQYLHLSVYSQTYPSGFSQQNVVTGLSNPTAMAFAPDGRVLVCQQAGQLRVVKNGVLLSAPAISLSVNSSGERGLLGVAFDPAFASNGFIYLYYTTSSSPIHNIISRFTLSGDAVLPGSELVLQHLENLSATNHNGGALAFGPDGKLYIAVGDNAVSGNAQLLTNRLGKILRINSDGSIPANNPFVNTAGARGEIWCYGLRNPYTMAFQPGTGTFFVNDVGQNSWEEINDATTAGHNFGWPGTEGDFVQASFPNFSRPIYAYSHGSSPGQGFAITGGCFFNPSSSNYPAEYRGNYFFHDFSTNFINRLVPSAAGARTINSNVGTLAWTNTTFATGISGASVGISTGTDGNLYYLSRSTGALVKIVSDISLPLNLLAFTVAATEAKTVKIDWKIALEAAPFTFEVERSIDAQNWQKLATLAGQSDISSYSFVDTQPIDGPNFYRLKMRDSASKTNYSGIKQIVLDYSMSLLYPNPAQDFILLPAEFNTLHIYNSKGTNVTAGCKIANQKIHIAALPPGLYFVLGQDKIYKFVKEP